MLQYISSISLNEWVMRALILIIGIFIGILPGFLLGVKLAICTELEEEDEDLY